MWLCYQTHHEVETEGVGKGGGAVTTKSFNNLETTWGQDDGGTDPETTVGRKSSGTKGVANGHLPHTGEKLDKTTVGESGTNDERWGGDTASSQVDEGEDEGGQGESGETKRSWVGKLAVGGRLVETWLEFTTKGRKTDRVASVDVGERVSTVVVWLPLLGGVGVGYTGMVVTIDAVVVLLNAACIDVVVHVVVRHVDVVGGWTGVLMCCAVGCGEEQTGKKIEECG